MSLIGLSGVIGPGPSMETNRMDLCHGRSLMYLYEQCKCLTVCSTVCSTIAHFSVCYRHTAAFRSVSMFLVGGHTARGQLTLILTARGLFHFIMSPCQSKQLATLTNNSI